MAALAFHWLAVGYGFQFCVSINSINLLIINIFGSQFGAAPIPYPRLNLPDLIERMTSNRGRSSSSYGTSSLLLLKKNSKFPPKAMKIIKTTISDNLQDF